MRDEPCNKMPNKELEVSMQNFCVYNNIQRELIDQLKCKLNTLYSFPLTDKSKKEEEQLSGDFVSSLNKEIYRVSRQNVYLEELINHLNMLL